MFRQMYHCESIMALGNTSKTRKRVLCHNYMHNLKISNKEDIVALQSWKKICNLQTASLFYSN